ncbi:uncharacterized protein BDZ99DRAFT_338759, partial [Mytilinidion resinicola]
SIPDELQLQILELCDMTTLAAICRTNKEWYAKASPIIWSDIDFVELSGDGAYDDGLIDQQRQFFATCSTRMDERPDFWAALAARVQSLKLTRMPGIAISYKSKAELNDSNDYIFIEIWPRDRRNIYDVIAEFKNLHTLYLFVKDWWEFSSIGESEKAVAHNLEKLTNLKVGGQINQDMMLALLSRPENIQHLSLINLIHSPGQDNGPNPVLFLRSIQKRFTNLKTLHMSKLAELTEDTNITGARWEFDPAAEIDLLEEWADFLRHVSATL